MAHDVFISYSTKDAVVADAVCNALESQKVRCWYAPRDIRGGTTWTAAIMRAIPESRLMVYILTANSKMSADASREVEHAFRRGITVIPFRLDDIAPTDDLQYYLEHVHWLDAFPPPLQPHVERLVSHVIATLAELGPAEAADSVDGVPAVKDVVIPPAKPAPPEGEEPSPVFEAPSLRGQPPVFIPPPEREEAPPVVASTPNPPCVPTPQVAIVESPRAALEKTPARPVGIGSLTPWHWLTGGGFFALGLSILLPWLHPNCSGAYNVWRIDWREDGLISASLKNHASALDAVFLGLVALAGLYLLLAPLVRLPSHRLGTVVLGAGTLLYAVLSVPRLQSHGGCANFEIGFYVAFLSAIAVTYGSVQLLKQAEKRT